MSSGGSYDPHAVEAEIYRFWEQGGYFHAEPNPHQRPYVIDIPLPNVTGALHLGHALNNTIQDILIRHKRMCGYAALWIPGTDHAGIATQAVVERKLKEEQNLTRHQLGRDGLVQKIWEWKEKYGEQILTQLRRMGCSCDWTRTRFTLDDVCARAVYEVFFQWFKAGLIYRGERLVNWDAYLQTAVADDEIVHETVKGHLWHVRYPIERHEGTQARRHAGDLEGREYLVVATTRPETMLGDTAVAVHPDDERYKHLIGRRCLLPLMNRPIPIIADPILVKIEFGTGCVKVTPGHDPNDYECAKRHNLPMINILTPDGKINENGGAYQGMDRYDAREKVVADLEALRLMEKIEPYETEVGHSDRSKTPIEPMLSEQWFVKMGDLAEAAMEAVRDGRVKFFPERYAKTYLDWLGEKRDWCISRQLWWGHRIPVWTRRVRVPDDIDEYCADGLNHLLDDSHGYSKFGVTENNFLVRVIRVADQATVLNPARVLLWPRPVAGVYEVQICYTGGREEVERGLEAGVFVRDPDVLDTWFSSALWPFSTLGWPHKEGTGNREQGTGGTDASPRSLVPDPRSPIPNPPTPADFEHFYPTSTLVTARGIITLWVARMVMTGLYCTRRAPFQHVHIHPIILDGQGRIMSKSLGNGVDPLDIIELYGTDALRFVMAQMDTETQDVRMPVKPVKLPGGPGVPPGQGRTVNSSEKFEIGRNFCNKIWQAATGFVLPNLEGYAPRPLTPSDLALEDHWILSRLTGCIAAVDRRLEQYQISDVASTLYAFFWNDFCDWYVELVKPRLYTKRDGAAGFSPRGAATSGPGSAPVAQQVLAWVLDQSLRLLHPILPFITEALWKKLNAAAPRRGINQLIDAEPALIRAAWPDANAWPRNLTVEQELDALQNVIRGLRDTLAWINTTRSATRKEAIGKLPHAVIRAAAPLVPGLREQGSVLCRLGRCETLEIGDAVSKPPESATKVFPGIEVFVPIGGLADLEVERQRLHKERGQLAGHIERTESKLANEGFVAKAPPAVVDKERARLAELREQLAALERHLTEIAT